MTPGNGPRPFRGEPYQILDRKIADTLGYFRRPGCGSLGIDNFGGNIRVLFCDREPRMPDVLPANVHDLSAACENVPGILRPFLEDLPVLADPG